MNHERDREIGRLRPLSPEATLAFDLPVLGAPHGWGSAARGACHGTGGRGKLGFNL